jgi:hypothetical protein
MQVTEAASQGSTSVASERTCHGNIVRLNESCRDPNAPVSVFFTQVRESPCRFFYMHFRDLEVGKTCTLSGNILFCVKLLEYYNTKLTIVAFSDQGNCVQLMAEIIS